MRKLIDLTGQRFGRLLVIRRVECEKHGEAKWLCQCDCGNETAVFGYLLRSGKTSSCGCSKHDETFRNKKKEQSTVHGGCGTRLYRIWIGMKNRCYNPNAAKYKDYGGRGITICAEWKNDFPAFRDWALSHGYTDALSIDRIDVDGNYEPSNCRWATAKEQRHNRRDN